MGVSENRLNPIVPNGFADHYPVMKNGYFIGKINPTFSDKPILEESELPTIDQGVYRTRPGRGAALWCYLLLALLRSEHNHSSHWSTQSHAPSG